jgi:DNA topoisomerase I
MPKKLVIVESPSKAKTIQKYLGDDYIIESSFGHIRDLPKKDLSIDIDKNFEPNYVISSDKKELAKKLKALAKKVDEVLLATDEDREGEAISWHLCEILDLNPATAKRISYTEITKEAIKRAVENPRNIKMGLVNAQQARRVVDRLVGYKLSPVLWKKVKPSLSAGRVQSVAVRLIVEREKEINAFKSESSYKVTAVFEVDDEYGKKVLLKADLPKNKSKLEEARAFLESCAGSDFKIDSVEKKPAKRNPAPPFTTSTLQQEASRKLGFPVAKTMTVAQKLYEAGHITYMRTDSLNLSQTAINSAVNAITSNYGSNYVKTRQYVTKTEGAQEAHEAIRPTDFSVSEAGGNSDEKRLYDLIWKRSIASQMSSAELERTLVDISISKASEKLVAKGEVLKFDGFLKVYLEGRDEDEEDEDTGGILPPLREGQLLDLKELTATERFSRPAPRYTEASLVKKLEELGIGRPSTYAPTISTIQKRNYVVKENRDGEERSYNVLVLKGGKINEKTAREITGAEKAKLFPTDIGIVVTDFLIEHFPEIIDFDFTAQMEQQFDEVAKGNEEWQKMVAGFYFPFEKTVDNTIETADRATGERLLGNHPQTGEPVIARMGRYGPMVQIGTAEDDAKPQYAKLLPTQNIGTITLQEALELFKLPRVVGQFEQKDIKASVGKFGPYLVHNNQFYSITKASGFDPYTINLDEAVQLIEEKRKSDSEKFIKEFKEEDIQILNGRWGPYIKQGKNNFKIPKDVEASALTLQETLEIINAQPQKKGKFKSKK